MLCARKKLLDRGMREKLENTRTQRQSETMRSRGQHKIAFEETVIEDKIICVWKPKWKPKRDWWGGPVREMAQGLRVSIHLEDQSSIPSTHIKWIAFPFNSRGFNRLTFLGTHICIVYIHIGTHTCTLLKHKIND